MYDVIIIGAGPAGVSAAIYAASRGLNFIVFESNEIAGRIAAVSSVTHYEAVANDESGSSYKERCRAQLEKYNVEIIKEKVESLSLDGNVKLVKSEAKEYEAKAIILATGMRVKKLGILGEEEFGAKGVYYSAAAYADQYKGKPVLLVGGSDAAAKEALYLADKTAEVHMVLVEEQLVCIAEFAQKIKNKNNIVLHCNSSLVAIEADESGYILQLIDNKTKVKSSIKQESLGVFIFAGALANNELFKNDLDMEGEHVLVQANQATSKAGVFACGDICVKQVRQIATAVADGAVAAISVANYIKTH